MRLARISILLIAAVAVPLALATSTLMGLHAVASGQAPTLRAALLGPLPAPERGGWRQLPWRRDRIADAVDDQAAPSRARSQN